MNETLSKERIKFLARLLQKKVRRSERLVVIEGENIISQLTDNGIFPLELYHSERVAIPPNLSHIPALYCTEHDMQRFSEAQTSPGLAALYPIPEESVGEFSTALYLDGISDPGNLGTIFRTCAAFGIGAILLSPECAEVFSPKVIRASLGSVFWMPHITLSHAELLARGNALYCLIMDGKTSLESFDPPLSPAIYVIGSEAHGISPELSRQASGMIRISMAKGMESLNAGIAVGILAHHLHIAGKNRADNN